MREAMMTVGDVSLLVRLRDTPTADKIWAALPLYAAVQTWGEEVYFTTAISRDLEDDARSVVAAGEIAFWPDGNAIAIGFAPTPISHGNEIRLASPCNIWADAVYDVCALKAVPAGAEIAVVQAPSGD